MHDMAQASEPLDRSDSIDFSILDELRVLQDDDDADLVAEVVELFLEDSPHRLDAIRAAAARGEAGQLGKSAHGLKGSAANVGAIRLRSVCERLEYLGKSGNLSGCDALVAELDAEYPRVTAALAPLVRAGRS